MKSRTSRKKKLHKATNIYDVARHARVSVFTVSAVVNKIWSYCCPNAWTGFC